MYGDDGMLIYVSATKTANYGSLDGKSRVATRDVRGLSFARTNAPKCKPAQPAKLCIYK